jgi:hypothetical protein
MARTAEEIKQRRRERYHRDKLTPGFIETIRAKSVEKYKNNPTAEIERRTQYFIDNPEKYLLTTIKGRCKRDNIKFDLTESDFKDLPTHCPVFNIPLERNLGKRKWSRYALSVDKIQPALGYVSGNIQILSRLANNMKSEATPEELLKFADWIYKTYGSKKESS